MELQLRIILRSYLAAACGEAEVANVCHHTQNFQQVEYPDKIQDGKKSKNIYTGTFFQRPSFSELNFESTCCEGQALPNECPEDACSQQIKNQFGNIHMKFSLQLCHATKYILDQIWNFGDLKIEKTFTIVERNKDPSHFLGDVKVKSK